MKLKGTVYCYMKKYDNFCKALSKKEVTEYSPIIASKLAMTTAAMTAEDIAKEMLELIPKVSG